MIAHRNAQGLDGLAIARMMPEIISYGYISEIQGKDTKGERVFISYKGHTAVLSLYKFDNRQTWLLTGWIDNTSDAQIEGYDSISATNNGATLTRPIEGAEVDSNINPIGADGKALFQNQTSPIVAHI